MEISASGSQASDLVIESEEVHYPVEAFPRLAAAEASHWWFRSRNRILIWAFGKYAPNCRDFLEIGCGTGFVLEGVSKAFPSLRLSGAEFYEEALSFAKQRVPMARFKRVDATKMDEHEEYDCIGAFDVVEHIEDDTAVLINLRRALRPGGTLMLTVPQHSWLWSIVDEHSGHFRRYTRDELLKKLKLAGLSVAYVSSFVSLLVPLMWLNRRRPKDQQTFDLQAEFKIPRWLNFILETIMRIEVYLIRAGFKFPVGGSLLVVARKP
jgi:SAM-dependent methyltransferase